MILYGKKVKQTIIVYDIKVGICSELNENINLYQYERSMSFVDLGSRSIRFNIFKLIFSLETAKPTEAKFHMEPQWDSGMKSCSNSLGRMTKTAAMATYG